MPTIDDELDEAFSSIARPVEPMPVPLLQKAAKPLLERDERARVAFEYLRHCGFTEGDYARYMLAYRQMLKP